MDKCRICGCTDDDCRQCIEKTGEPCFWIEPDLCSACGPEEKENKEKERPRKTRVGIIEGTRSWLDKLAILQVKIKKS